MKLFPWPFPTGEIWTLIATQTPERLIDSIDIYKRSHWRFNAIFSHGHGGKTKFVTICFPWALFPLVRCGDQYRDGQRLPHSSIGTQESLDLAGLTQPTLERMNHSLPPHFKNYIVNHSTFSEFMFVWKDGKRRILLPVLEMLRALFVKNNTFALGILDPIFLSSVGQWSIKDRILNIEFRDKFPLPLRRSEDRKSVV